jgi:2',3'-cyclic-nucleotide 2'-phosphodiesterase (5'-nucleotidase family)
MMYYFKTAPTGFTSDGTPIADPALHMNPIVKAFNSMNYDAWVLGNHEFNFGSAIFASVLGQATFPLLQANVAEDPAHPYGLAAANILPYVEKTVGGDINIAILGIGNHRVPNYELPSNIPGLTFSDPIAKAQELSTLLRPTNDVVIALTHIGFTENPASVEVDANVDTNLVATVHGLDAVIGGHSHTNPATGFGAYKYLPSIVVDPDGKPVIVGQAYRYNNTLGEMSIGLRPLGGGNYQVVSQTGRYLSVSMSTSTLTPEDPAVKAIADPYVALLAAYNNKVIGQTTTPIDALQAYTQETNGANLQADASVYELSVKHSIPVDFHLSGAMTNSKIAAAATPAAPYSLKISDMFTAMPYENSLVVISMNGPQLKAVLERAYRNYYYYKYVSGYGGYSYYTTCMLDTNFGNQITYNDLSPALPNGNNVVSLVIGGVPVDFSDAAKYYNVSTVNYLAAGSCNFNNSGVTLWPLNQIVADTQYYVRDAVIDYVTFMGTISPAIEGRLSFITDSAPPTITKTLGTPIFTSGSNTYLTSATTLTVNVGDAVSGLASCTITVAGPGGTTNPACTVGDNVLNLAGPDGAYLLTVNAVDKAGNVSPTFTETDILDNTGPILTKTIGTPVFVNGPTTFVKSNTLISVAFDDSTGSGVAGCTLKLDGGSMDPYTGTAFSLPGPDGAHTLSVACTDNLGNSSTLDETDTVDDTAPVITINAPLAAQSYLHPNFLTLDFNAVDALSGLRTLEAKLDGTTVTNGQKIDLYTLSLGNHTLTVTAIDNLGNSSSKSVTFSVTATVQSLKASVNRFYQEGKIDNASIRSSLLDKLNTAQTYLNQGNNKAAKNALQAFINAVLAQKGKHIKANAADLLITDANWVIANLK